MNAGEEVDPDELARVWAIYCAARDIDGPAAFTTAWLDLPVEDVRRRAALVRSAFYNRVSELGLSTPAGADTRLADVRAGYEAALDLALSAVDADTPAGSSRFVEAADSRRATRIEAARASRLHDYPGGPVDWHTGKPAGQRSDAAA